MSSLSIDLVVSVIWHAESNSYFIDLPGDAWAAYETAVTANDVGKAHAIRLARQHGCCRFEPYRRTPYIISRTANGGIKQTSPFALESNDAA